MLCMHMWHWVDKRKEGTHSILFEVCVSSCNCLGVQVTGSLAPFEKTTWRVRVQARLAWPAVLQLLVRV